MPTNKPRFTITRTGDVEVAFEEVRRIFGQEPDPKDLLIRGARQKIAEANDTAESERRSREARERLITRARRGAELDTAAATRVRQEGWARDLDD